MFVNICVKLKNIFENKISEKIKEICPIESSDDTIGKSGFI